MSIHAFVVDCHFIVVDEHCMALEGYDFDEAIMTVFHLIPFLIVLYFCY